MARRGRAWLDMVGAGGGRQGLRGGPRVPAGPLGPPPRGAPGNLPFPRGDMRLRLRRNPDADELEVDASLHIEPGDELKVLESSDDGMWRKVCRSW